MPRTEAVLAIFLASPSDVADERARLAETVSEWNQTWSRNLGLRLELLRWESDAYPGIGQDAQDVINREIPDDYDLFVGLMWSRFGTPTGRAGSGTEEEFQRAMSRYRADPDRISIFFYFKDAPLPPSKVDTEQLRKVQEFKSSLGKEGVLHWDFADSDQFDKLFSLHITRHVQAWKHKQGANALRALQPIQLGTKSTEPRQPSQPIEIVDEDEGYLDLLETFSERNAEVAGIIERIGQAQIELNDRTTQGTQDLLSLQAMPNTATPAHARRLISKVADEMIRFTDRVNAEIPLFRSAIDSSMKALTRAATLSREFDPEHFSTASSAANGLLCALRGAKDATLGFRTTTAGLPRITKELNAAKRRQAAALDALIAEFDNAERLLIEAIAVVETLRPDGDAQH